MAIQLLKNSEVNATISTGTFKDCHLRTGHNHFHILHNSNCLASCSYINYAGKLNEENKQVGLAEFLHSFGGNEHTKFRTCSYNCKAKM